MQMRNQEMSSKSEIGVGAGWRRLVPLTLVFAAGWTGLYLLSAAFAVSPEASLWFLPAGWTVVFVILGGWRAWPLALTGPLLTTLVLHGDLGVALEYLPLDLRHVVCYGGLGLLLQGRLRAGFPLRDVASCFRFLYGVLGASLLSGCCAAVFFWLRDGGDLRGVLETGLAFWVGDAAGVILLTPVVLDLAVVRSRGLDEWRRVAAIRSSVAGVVVRLGVTVALVWIVLGPGGRLGTGTHLWYLLLLPIVWVALRDGPHGVVLAVIVMNLAVGLLARQQGPASSLLDLQLLLVVATATGLVLAAAMVDRGLALERALGQEQILQQQVEDRTRELTRLNEDLHKEIACHRRTEGELEQARDAAEAANRAKGRFLANMSHEVRTPLHAILGMCDLLLSSGLGRTQLEFASAIKSSGGSLLQIVNDILDCSRIEAGKLLLDHERFDLLQTVEDAVEVVAAHARDKGLELDWVLEPEVPAELIGDAGRLRQVLLNLLDNAVKFTDQGRVTLWIGCDAEGAAENAEGRSAIAFEVRDTGIGIPESALDRLFASFEQVDGSTTRRWGGSGLGLAICKHLAEMMGGAIRVETRLGAGSVFRFTARLARVDPAEAADGRRDGLLGGSVLLVSNDQHLRASVTALLDRWGMPTVVTDSVQQASRLVGRPTSGMPRLAGALIDSALLGGFGPGTFGVARWEAWPPLILLDGGTSHEQHEAVWSQAGQYEAALHEVLARPVRPSRLLGALRRIERPHRVDDLAPEPLDSSSASTWERRRILVAEDNPVNQKVAAIVLERLGYRVDLVATGVAAVESVLNGSYGLVLMDCQMPEMDGYEAAAQIRRCEMGGRRTPIVALTAHAMAGDRQRCLDAGMDDYLSKPVVASDLASMVERWAGRGHGAR